MTAVGDGLREWLSKTDLTMEQLVETAEAFVGAIAPHQTKYKVSERPDARTIRYYVTQGLLPKPVGYDGGRARYSGSHLLRLVWIKKLQAEHHTLSRIAHLLKDATDETVIGELETAIAHSEEPAAPPTAAGNVNAVAASTGITLTPELLADPEKRKKLAESLEELAAWLRQGS